MSESTQLTDRAATTLLLDAYNLLYRAFCSMPGAITDRHDLPIQAVYGSLSAVLKMARDLNATHAVAAFDVPATPTFRHQRFAGYQAQRGPMGGDQAEEFARQVEVGRRVFPLAGIPALVAPGYEADDVMGTLATRLALEGGHAVIVSTDRDLLQLVRPGVEVLTPGAGGVHARSSDDVVERMGVPPEGITTLKALAGDASDNIPGVRGIGGKTAASLVNTYGSLEAIYGALDKLTPRTATLLEAGRDEAFLYRDIVTVVTDLDIEGLPALLPELQFDAKTRAREIIDRLG